MIGKRTTDLRKIEFRYVDGEALDNNAFDQLRNEGEIRNGAVLTTCVWIHSGFLKQG